MFEIESYPVGHYENQYHETDSKNVQTLMEEMEVLAIPKLDQNKKQQLDRPVTDVEIERAVYQLGPHKAPEPDGIPTSFTRNFGALSGKIFSQLCACFLPLRFYTQIS